MSDPGKLWIKILERPLNSGLYAEIYLNQSNKALEKPFFVRLRRTRDDRYLWALNNSLGHQNTLVTGALKHSLDFDEVAWLLNEADSWLVDDERCVFLEEDPK